MMSETRRVSEKQTDSKISEGRERVSNTTTDSQNYRLSDFSEDWRQVDNFCQAERAISYKKFFQPKVQQETITHTLHKKAINWLMTFCWTRNYTEEVLWYAVGYFYSYSYSKTIQKDRLTLILISAINLAIKLFQPDSVMGFQTMKGLLNNAWDPQDFRSTEAEILEIFDFDLYFPTVLGDIVGMGRTDEDKAKILFIAQCLFMNSYEPAINDIILEDMIFMSCNPESELQLRSEVKKLLKNPKFMEVIKQKYASKFNIDEFLQKLLDEK